MGMDVYGKYGAYFRANIWQWGTILYVMDRAGYEIPYYWDENGGHGLSTQEDCDELADLLIHYLSEHQDEVFSRPSRNIAMTDNYKLVAFGTPGSRSPYEVTREHLEEWIEFLQTCGGGFNIY